jgi:uncharacterized repeat protein (TIGR03943 family)
VTFDEAAAQAEAVRATPLASRDSDPLRDILVVDWLGQPWRPRADGGWERHDGAGAWVAADVPLWLWPRRVVPALTLAWLGVLLLLMAWKMVTGQLALYVNPGSLPLSLLGLPLLGLLLIGGARRVHGRASASWSFLVLGIPVLLSLVPARPLGAEAAVLAGLNTAAVSAGPARADTRRIPPLQRDLLDWAITISREADLSALAGEPVQVEGLLLPPPDTLASTTERVILARFVMLHCTADLSTVGLHVATGAAYPPDTWLRVRGTLAVETTGSQPQVLILPSEIEPIPAPAQPYLFP